MDDEKNKNSKIFNLNKKNIQNNKNKTKDLLGRIELLVYLISKISFDIDIKTYLSELLKTSFQLIPEADAGSVFLYGKKYIEFIDAIGHDINALKDLQIPTDAFTIERDEIAILTNIMDFTLAYKLLDADTQKKFIKATLPIKESLTVDLNLHKRKIFGITLDITEKNNNHFTQDSVKVMQLFKKLSDLFITLKDLYAIKVEKEKFLETTLRSIGEGIIVLDKRYNVISINNAAKEIIEIPENIILNKNINEFLKFINYTTGKAILIFQNNESIKRTVRYPEVLLVNRKNREKICSFTVSPIKSDIILGYVLVLKDISAILELQEELLQTSKLKTLGEISGSIAHDFNNMLSGIMGNAELLKYEKDKKNIKEIVNEIIDISNKAKTLTLNLLDFSRKGKFATQIVDIHANLESALNIFCMGMNKRIKLIKHFDAQNYFVRGSEAQISNGFLNILLNSKDAIVKDGIIEIKTENIYVDKDIKKEIKKRYVYSSGSLKKGDYIFIFIKDTGAGMDEKTLSNIFKPFFTTKSENSGTGLGMSSVLAMINDNNGIISIYSKIGEGTTVQIGFPVIEKDLKQKEKFSKDKNEYAEGKGNIVIIDDEHFLVNLISKFLSRIGFTINAFVEPHKGLEYIKKNYDKIDLIILDIIMPELDGLQIFKSVKKIKKDMKFILISGYTKNKNITKILKKNDVLFLQKPFELIKLKEAIGKVLENKIKK